ncbi:MAG: hypothetical protein K0M67_08600, partial [Thiobacillus sp.]|nr:hypothetical protein [Thiobacillus sp.]
GTDTVDSAALNYTLSANVENLILREGANRNGTGNASDNVLTGNGQANLLSGLDGNDSISGGQGNDTLMGGAGNDTLGGGIGVDLMIGGTRDDLYVINDTAEFVVELAGEGTDTVDSAALNYTLSANVENLILREGANRNGTGNASDNVLTGNGQANLLLGLGGNDTLVGGAGNDSMNGGQGNDVFIFGSGFGQDLINGFDADPAGGQDLLDISLLAITAGNFGASVSISAVGGNTLIGIGAGSITLVGVNAATVTQQDFILA